MSDKLEELTPQEQIEAIERWAKNETRAMKTEDEDEKIVGWGRKLIRAEEEDMEVFKTKQAQGGDVVLLTAKYDEVLVEIQREAAVQGSKYSGIFQCQHTRRFLETILRISAHFRATKHLRLIGLSRMTDVHGGVSEINNDRWKNI